MSHRYRLYPTGEQQQVLALHCRDARYVWNIAVEQDKHARVLGQHADQKQWDKNLSEARQAFGWLAEGSSSVQQAALRDLRQAYRNWWGNPAHFRPPTWRKEGVSDGFVVRDLVVAKLNRRWAELTVPKAGRVRFRLSRPLPEGAKSARVTLDRAGRWHVSVVAPQPEFAREPTGAVVGLDMGVTESVTTSDGEHVRMPPLLSEGERRRSLRLQRRLARQQKGSRRREATRRSLARMSAREADRRNDWIEQTTTRLVRDHDLIVVEDLRVRNMTRSAKGTRESPGKNVRAKAGLNRSIRGQAWATFRKRLTDKAGASGSCEVVAVPAAFTSLRCSGCGHTGGKNRESQAAFSCRACGYTDNADVNAAKNILAAGLAVAGRGGSVRPRPAPAGEGSPVEAPTDLSAAGASRAA